MCRAWRRWDCFPRRRTCSSTLAASRLRLTHVRSHTPFLSITNSTSKSGAVLTVLCCHPAAITKGEQVLWHDQYIKSAAELCQWEAIAECVSHRPLACA
jgi:hypothetical protein